jgi:asparagine synthase (glutamine-hydrolysing)
MRAHIPEQVSRAEKQGFSAPDASWFKGESIEFVRQRLMTSNARIYNFMDSASVQALVQEHLDGKQNRRLLIWSLLNVEQWLETFH